MSTNGKRSLSFLFLLRQSLNIEPMLALKYSDKSTSCSECRDFWWQPGSQAFLLLLILFEYDISSLANRCWLSSPFFFTISKLFVIHYLQTFYVCVWSLHPCRLKMLSHLTLWQNGSKDCTGYRERGVTDCWFSIITDTTWRGYYECLPKIQCSDIELWTLCRLHIQSSLPPLEDAVFNWEVTFTFGSYILLKK